MIVHFYSCRYKVSGSYLNIMYVAQLIESVFRWKLMCIFLLYVFRLQQTWPWKTRRKRVWKWQVWSLWAMREQKMHSKIMPWRYSLSTSFDVLLWKVLWLWVVHFTKQCFFIPPPTQYWWIATSSTKNRFSFTSFDWLEAQLVEPDLNYILWLDKLDILPL